MLEYGVFLGQGSSFSTSSGVDGGRSVRERRHRSSAVDDNGTVRSGTSLSVTGGLPVSF